MRTARPVPWSRRSSSSSSTDSSFWKEHKRIARSLWRAASRSVCVVPSASSEAVIGPCVALLFTGVIFLPFRCTFCLYGALALAPFHLERRAAVPVDELVHRLQAKIDRHRQLLDQAFELAVAHAAHELVKRLAVGALGFVVADPALDRVGH